MGFLTRKKIEKPKNPLGLAVYQYDHIVQGKLGKIIDALLAQKPLNPLRTAHILETSLYEIDHILDDISKENLKTDYRSDKTRYTIIAMIQKRKSCLQAIEKANFYYGQMQKDRAGDLAKAASENIKNDLKETQSDYI